MTAALEARLGRMFGTPHNLMVGRASTAIHLALELIGDDGEVLVPAIGCANIAQIVLYAGFTPRWVDVNLDAYTIDVDTLEAAITPRTRAILAVHVFGHACDMDRIMDIASRHGLVVIEDAAQSLGGTYKGRPLGSIGHFGVFSFAGSKIIDAGAGGALALHDEALAGEARKLREALPRFERRTLEAVSHRNLYHAAVDLLRADETRHVEGIIQASLEHYRHLYRSRYPEEYADRLHKRLDALPGIVAKRVAAGERYDERLAALPVERPRNWRTSGTLWRYTFLTDDALRVTEHLRKHRIHASNHYWSLADLFAGVKSLPHARRFSPRVVNLWVDDVADEAYIARSCDLIAEALS